MKDKENTIDIIIAKQTAQQSNATVRWIPRTLVVADGLTKGDGVAADRLRAVTRRGWYRIGDEQGALQRNKEEKERRLARGKERARHAEEEACEREQQAESTRENP